jgi:hypothetical protein
MFAHRPSLSRAIQLFHMMLGITNRESSMHATGLTDEWPAGSRGSQISEI